MIDIVSFVFASSDFALYSTFATFHSTADWFLWTIEYFVMWFHIIFEHDQAKPSGLDQDYLKYSDYAVVTGNPININFLEFLIFKQANRAKKSFNSWWNE